MKKTLLFLVLLSSIAFGDATTGNTRVHNSFDEASVTNTVNAQTKELANRDGADSESSSATIGTVFQIMKLMYGVQVGSQNREEVSSDALKVDHDEASMSAFNAELIQQIESDAVSNNSVGISSNPGQFKCYIARDIPFQYECSESKLVYGGGVNETGKQARDTCRSECYVQNNCYNSMSASVEDGTEAVLDDDPEKLDFTEKNVTYEISYNLDEEKELVLVKTQVVVEDENGDPVDSKNFKADVYITDRDGVETLAIKRNFMLSLGSEKSWFIGLRAKKIRILYYNEEEAGFFARFIKYEAEYEGEAGWFCPGEQDITNMNIVSFAGKCPSGVTKTVTSGSKTAEICVDGESAGDNKDGTFSEKQRCESICRIAFSCSAVQQVKSTAQVENYREGCLAGQGNCDDGDCKIARISDMSIINETVFDAEMNPTTSIESGNQVSGVDRPRFSKEETLNFEDRMKEEWKDFAYKDMVINNRYNSTIHVIGEDTEQSSAFAVGIGSHSTGKSNGLHELIWKLKPRAFDVNSDSYHYLYTVFEVDAEYWGYNQRGKEVAYRDRIFFIKTSEADTFKAFKRYKDYGEVTIDERGIPVVAKNDYSTAKSETFTGSSWVSLSESSLAPYFKQDKFVDPEFYLTYKLAFDLRKINYEFKGLKRSKIKDGPTETPVYTGYFDGKGDNVARIAAHTYVSKTKLTYDEVFSKIREDESDEELEGQFDKIYDTGFDKKSTRILSSDGDDETHPDIKIYRYGKTEKSTVFFTIKPDKELVGQKGFIYVFIY